MIRQINRVTFVLVLLLLLLIANTSVIQVFQAKHLKNEPGNQRRTLTEYSHPRGTILVGSRVIAESVETSDTLRYQRRYPEKSIYAPVTGFYSLIYGATELENEENEVLTGNDSRFLVNRLQQLFASRKSAGGTIRLTLNNEAQEVAMRELNGRTGAVVAIDAKTGAILALASSPSFDPNLLASHNTDNIQTAYSKLDNDSREPLLNRSIAMTLPPGSTFKLITAAAALSSGRFTPDSLIPGPARLKLPQSSHYLTNWNGQSCGPNNQTTLAHALAISCNTAFAWLGMKLGAQAIANEAQKFGFDSTFEIPMPAAASRFPTQLDQAQTAMSAIGQYDVQATALQMAVATSGIANNGIVMRPYLVAQVLGPDLSVLENAQPSALSRALTSHQSGLLKKMMVGVVNSGTGTNARIPGVTVGGKTGTAETAPGKPAHAWFVAWAQTKTTNIAVAVVLQNGGGAREISGNGLAAPIAAKVIRAVLGQ